MSKNLCIIQARMSSTRLPGKVLKKINNIPLLEYEINRVKLSKKIDKIVVATSTENIDNQIEKLCRKIGIDCFRGYEKDVLGRYFECSLRYKDYDNIIRITGDCPLIDPDVIDELINLFEKNNCDYASNIEEETFPDGMDVEIFKKEILEKANKKANLFSEREHVTPYIRNNKKFKKFNLKAKKDYSNFRLTVDEQEDFEVIKFLINNLGVDASYLDYIKLLKKNPRVILKNMHIKRNEGLKKSLKEDKIINNRYE